MLYISESYCLNEIGGRAQSEDAVWPLKEAVSAHDRLFMVCDGVGGSNYGEVASALTCEGFGYFFQQHLPHRAMPDAAFVEDARAYVMKQFEHFISQKTGAENMSTTLTMAYVGEKSVLIAWCGDSRVYQVRQGMVIFQSEDHSLVSELVKQGELSPEEASSHPQRNVILRAIQYKERLSEIDCIELTDVQEGDFILLCSDGLLENVGEGELQQLLTKPHSALREAFQELCQGRTRDNYSMYLLRIGVAPQQPVVVQPEIEAHVQPTTESYAQPAKGKPKSYLLLSLLVLAGLLFVSWHLFLRPGGQSPNPLGAANPPTGNKVDATVQSPASNGLAPIVSNDARKPIVEKLDSAFAEKKAQQNHFKMQPGEPQAQTKEQRKENKKQELIEEVLEKRSLQSAAADTLSPKRPQKNQSPDIVSKQLD